MDDKTKNLEPERVSGSAAAEYISGREALDREGRIGERGTSRIPSRPSAGAPEPVGRRMDSAAGSHLPGAVRSGANAPSMDPATDARTRRLQAEIEQTRGELSETVDAIQDRLRPGAVAANAAESLKNSVRHAASDQARMIAGTARDMAESEPVQYVRANPIPAAMVGIGLAGLAWLAFGGNDARSSGSRRVGRTARDWRRMGPYDESDRFYRGAAARRNFAGDPADARTASFGDAGFGETGYPGQGGYETAAAYTPDLTQAWQSAYGTDSGMARHAGSGRRDYAGSRQAQAGQQVQRVLQRTWQQSPLLMGAASAALGLMVGLAVPQTETENEYMGEAREHAFEGVQQTVRETVSKVQEAATAAAGLLAGDDAAASRASGSDAASSRASGSDAPAAVRNQEQTPLRTGQPGRNPGIA